MDLFLFKYFALNTISCQVVVSIDEGKTDYIYEYTRTFWFIQPEKGKMLNISGSEALLCLTINKT